MKLSVITDEFTQNLDEAITVAKSYGLDALELRSVEDIGIFDLPIIDAKRMAKKIFDAELEVSALSSPFFKCSIDSEQEIETNIKGLKHCIKLAEIFNTKLIRGFAFWRKEGPVPIKRIVELFQQPIELLKGTDLTLVLEDDPSVYGCDAKELIEIIKAIDSPYVKALWDPGNVLYAFTNERTYPDGYEIVKPYMRHVHLKDSRLDENGEAIVCRITEGTAMIPEMLERLAEDGYKGFLTLESHYRINSVISEETYKLPGGASFSAGGFQSTCECLETVCELLGRSYS